jgi:HEAT repeat protein
LLAHLPLVKVPKVRSILQEAADRIGRTHMDELMRILRTRDSAALAEAVGVCARMALNPTVSAVGDLVSHRSAEVRRAAVEALGTLGTPGAIALLERGLDDADRAVRLAAVSVVAARGYKGALKRLEAVVGGTGPHELERAEKRQFFEAYAAVAGESGLELLADLLEPKGLFRRKEPAEIRTCAAYAVALIRTPAARDVLQRATQDKELSVRNAASRALRDWGA